MKIQEIKVKTALVKSKLPVSEWVINPYRGCGHGCLWCYARFTEKFASQREGREVRPWGSFVDVKVNVPEILEKQLRNLPAGRQGLRTEELKNLRTSGVFLSSVTDCYQPLEAKYQLTRKILEILLAHQIPVFILTESALVLRDLGLLIKLPKAEVGFTLITIDPQISRLFQPQAALPQTRINALKTLHEAGIKTYIHVGPYLPEITDFGEIFKAVRGLVDYVEGEMLNPKGENFTNLACVLAKRFPNLLPLYKEIFFGQRRGNYFQKTQKEFYQMAKKYHLLTLGFWSHS